MAINLITGFDCEKLKQRQFSSTQKYFINLSGISFTGDCNRQLIDNENEYFNLNKTS